MLKNPVLSLSRSLSRGSDHYITGFCEPVSACWHCAQEELFLSPNSNAEDGDLVEEEEEMVVADKLPRAIRCMEHAIANVQLADCLLQKGVVDVLLSLFEIRIPPVTHNGFEHATLAAMRVFGGHKMEYVAKPLAQILRSKLMQLVSQLDVSPASHFPIRTSSQSY